MESADHPNSRNPIRTNPLRTRDDLRLAFDQLSLPLQPFYSEGAARIELGDTGTSYSPSVAGMEGFSRVLWGMVPLLAGGGDSELWATCLRGIVSGTNPEHEEYWGDIRDYDQRLVEMASFGFALATIPEKIWEPLSDEERERLYRWLNQINGHPVWDCNWLFFRVLVNIGFRRIGRPYDKEQLVRNLNRIDEFYAGEGWFTDGIGGHADYYGPFAIHYYGLLYAKLMREEDPERAARFRERSALFARSFIHWFADDGSALPYGRSMAYRFAQAAFWSAYAYADAGADSGANAIPAGVVKGIVLRHLRWWFRQPIFDAAGVLTIGYRYPSLVIAEQYNSPGSPYWALKTFLPLALAKDHPFWSAEELPLPDLDALSVQKPADLVLVRRKETDHVAAFNAGHAGTNEHAHTSAKYEKFAYSTAFGFSVPKAEWGVAQGAFDSTLALSERDNLFRVRRCNEETRIDGRLLYSRWKPWADVEVRTWIVAGLPRHLRIHRIDSARPLDVAEGGFALGLQDDTLALAEGAKAVASGALGTSAIVSHAGFERAEAVHAQPNTNVLHPRTVIPTLRGSLEPGVHWLVSEVYGEPGGRQDPGSPAFVATIGEDRIDIAEHGGARLTVLF
ncbi:DUF2264 domain-containing protein [Cohnella fermenti]|uniref:DUF2264 domain-containing protein n=1 Tax=Cohnella fermenti TaxID=2565925 RepID=A0A4S4BKC9_9BACL|nr:DUF2264 domain-containing protein [Cohnella fermenti]THF74930.1 DUF2264 domain-containing protein [Cohnella fermenti]